METSKTRDYFPVCLDGGNSNKIYLDDGDDLVRQLASTGRFKGLEDGVGPITNKHDIMRIIGHTENGTTAKVAKMELRARDFFGNNDRLTSTREYRVKGNRGNKI